MSLPEEKTAYLTFKINLPMRHFVSRDVAIQAAHEALSVEVPRYVDALIDNGLTD